MKKIIIDTDPGHDDALALMLMCKSKLFDIKAVTTVAGNSTIENVTKNTAYILNLLNRKDIPVYSGKPKPLKRDLIQAVVHGKSGLDGVKTTKTKYKLSNNASDRIIKLVNNSPGKITILTLGPLSNIARAFIKDSKLPSLIKQIVIMGGAINVCGNKNRVAEFNMFVDPEAADIVFKSKVNKILVPLDCCNKIKLFNSDFNKLKNSKLYRPIKSMMKKYMVGIEKDVGVKGALVYDVLAAYYLLNPKAFRLKKMDIVIETKGLYTPGMTVVEKRKKVIRNFNTKVAMKVKKDVFRKDFINILKNNL